jgi:LysR family glycine cleavage system transcriptional activator
LALYDDIKPHFCAIDKTTASLNTENSMDTIFQIPEFFASDLFLPQTAEFSELNKDIDLQLGTLASGTKN